MSNNNDNKLTWSDIQKSRKLLESFAYSTVEGQNSRQEIDKHIGSYLGLAKNLNVSLTDVTRVLIESLLLLGKKQEINDLKNSINKFLNKEEAIEIENCFIVHDKSKEIISYLEEIRELDLINNEEDADFLCLVKIQDGFIAPLHLMTGPLRKFNEDWPKIGKEFDDSLKNSDSAILSRLQSSNFATWIGWGPSIPICKCQQWAYNKPEVQATLQYGFGDENNSLQLLIPDISEEETFEKIFGPQEERISEIIVRKVAITVKPSLLSQQTQNKLACAIREVNSNEPEKVNSGKPSQQEFEDSYLKNELFLKLEESRNIEIKGEPKKIDGKVKEPIGYYTAYLWILFGVTTENNPDEFISKFDDLGKRDRQENKYPWRSLLPFFEHVNLADPMAYKRQKKLLVCKALDFMNDYLKEGDNQSQGLKFIYLCAFDDPNCSTEVKFDLILKPEESIRDILQTLKDDNNIYQLPIIIWKNARNLASCHLTELIKLFNKHLETLETTKG